MTACAKTYTDEIDKEFIKLMKERHYELGLDEFCMDLEDLDDLITPYDWLAVRRGNQIADALVIQARQIIHERRIP